MHIYFISDGYTVQEQSIYLIQFMMSYMKTSKPNIIINDNVGYS